MDSVPHEQAIVSQRGTKGLRRNKEKRGGLQPLAYAGTWRG